MMHCEVIFLGLPNCWIDWAAFALLLLGPSLTVWGVCRARRLRRKT